MLRFVILQKSQRSSLTVFYVCQTTAMLQYTIFEVVFLPAKIGPTFLLFVVITAWFYLKQIVMWIDVGNTAQASRGNESKTEIKRIQSYQWP